MSSQKENCLLKDSVTLCQKCCVSVRIMSFSMATDENAGTLSVRRGGCIDAAGACTCMKNSVF